MTHIKRLKDIEEPLERFLGEVSKAIQQRGVQVNLAPVCRLKSEFSEAVSSFEANRVDVIVTLHLAYSPSLESAEVLSKTDLPVIVLDTTPDVSFGPEDEPEALMYNHGIHGVQDMCNLLIRNGKSFEIEVGQNSRQGA